MAASVDLVLAAVDTVWPQVEQVPAGWLSASEVQRLERIAEPRRAREFVASRGLMRMLLSAHTGYQGGWWQWWLEAPDEATPVVHACHIDGRALHLNLSHSQGLLACTLSESPVGVDLEVQRNRPRSDLDGLVQMVCSPQERLYLDRLPDAATRQRVFTQLWTLKESYFKWLGTGLDLASLPALCSQVLPHDTRTLRACCVAGRGDWAGRHYELSVCTGALVGMVRSVALPGVDCLYLADSTPSNLML